MSELCIQISDILVPFRQSNYSHRIITRPISTSLFGRRKLHKRVHRPALIFVLLNKRLPSKPDAPPFADKARASKQVWLNCHAIKAPHVERRIDPLEIDGRREHFHLLH